MIKSKAICEKMGIEVYMEAYGKKSWLEPSYRQSQKSFYKKAYILRADGNYVIYSYNTPVFGEIDGKHYRFWSDYSATTLRHISSIYPIGKKEWDAMEVTKY